MVLQAAAFDSPVRMNTNFWHLHLHFKTLVFSFLKLPEENKQTNKTHARSGEGLKPFLEPVSFHIGKIATLFENVKEDS